MKNHAMIFIVKLFHVGHQIKNVLKLDFCPQVKIKIATLLRVAIKKHMGVYYLELWVGFEDAGAALADWMSCA